VEHEIPLPLLRARGVDTTSAITRATALLHHPPAHATVELPVEARISRRARLRIEVAGDAERPVLVYLDAGEAIELGSAARRAHDEEERRAVIDDPTVSARHCRVVHTGALVEVTDHGSRNGVRVGGVRVPSAAVGPGGAFQIGRTEVHVDADEPAIPSRGGEAGDARLLPGLVGRSAAMTQLARAARSIAALRLPALLRGESGTGKDLVARAIHEIGPRAGKPFVALNAAAIARELSESELFGHVRGAFTGAARDRRGAFREAHGGTLFLDEIGSISLELQAKLLRVVEEGAVRPVGSELCQPVDVRLIAATCEPLEALVAERRFRADLYERLAVCVVHVPSLRMRREDIPALARHLLRASELGPKELAPGALAALRTYAFPGNVRELRNIVVQAAVRAGARVEADHVEEVLRERAGARRRVPKEEVLRIFEETGHNISAAARRASLPRSTVRDMLRAMGMR
jgi:Sigma-54 interaction domain/FHA domain